MRFLNNIYFAVAILLLTFAAGYYVDNKNDEMHGRQLVINTGLEKMLRLDQELTSMLLIAVLEQNILRTASYHTASASLAATIQTVDDYTQHLNLSEEMAALAQDHRQLRVVEGEAIKLMEQDKWEQAHTILFDESYVFAKKIHEINSDTAAGALTGELAATAKRFHRIRLTALGLRFAALLLLLWVGCRYSQRLRHDLEEKTRLRDAIALQNQKLEEKVHLRTNELETANRKLQALSSTDSLTGLANRRRFDEMVEQEWGRGQRMGQPLAVLMLDIDYFKQYNDQYGHQAGDECLRTIARLLQNAVRRSGDLAARYGGEEFALIIPETTGVNAQLIAESVRQSIEALALPHQQSSCGKVTVSIGISAVIPSRESNVAALILCADTALYRAKGNGRNRVVLSDDAYSQDLGNSS